MVRTLSFPSGRPHVAHLSMSSSRRLMHELKAIHAEKSNEEVMLTCVDETGLLDWRASIRGPPDTPYADIYFELIISVPIDYPLKLPVVSFATKVFHPNVHFKVRFVENAVHQLSEAVSRLIPLLSP